VNATAAHLLVVDDDPSLASTLQEFLELEGYRVETALSASEALAAFDRHPEIVVALVDLMMPVTDGMTLMDELHKRNSDLSVVIMTGYGTIETAVEAIKRGAEDYVTKPFDREAVRKKIARLTEVFELREKVRRLEAGEEGRPSFEQIVSSSSQMRRVLERARVAAATNASVLILGETGTGKELLAKAIHGSSRRAQRPLLPVNCGALPGELVESELFGYRKGAFTGAIADSPGLFRTATGGTVFLDEIGELPKEVQVKLLRVLQEGELRPVGSPRPVQVDVRLISASNRPLQSLRNELFREDFYYRIATVVIEIPPLRTRREDIVALAQKFVTRLCEVNGRQISLSRSAVSLLLSYSFPGNVRELENLLESATAVSLDDPQTIDHRDLRPLLADGEMAVDIRGLTEQPLSLADIERVAIQQALRMSGGNRTKAASILGISRDTLYRRLKHVQKSP